MKEFDLILIGCTALSLIGLLYYVIKYFSFKIEPPVPGDTNILEIDIEKKYFVRQMVNMARGAIICVIFYLVVHIDEYPKYSQILIFVFLTLYIIWSCYDLIMSMKKYRKQNREK